jgi:hypothetical protein
MLYRALASSSNTKHSTGLFGRKTEERKKTQERGVCVVGKMEEWKNTGNVLT